MRDTPAPADAGRLSPVLPDMFVAAFSNGVLDIENSDLPDTIFTSMRAVLDDAASPYAADIGGINAQRAHPILGLNAACLEEGFVLHLKKGESLARPLHIRFDWHGDETPAPEGRHIRILVLLEQGASATIVESHGGRPGFATIVEEIRLAEQAHLNHVRLEHLGAAARQSAVTLAECADASRYRGFYLSEGAHFCRHEALLELGGPGAHAEIDGACLVTGTRHCDNTTVLTHASPGATSRQSFRIVLADRARGVYQGCVKVRPEAQRTDAYQMSRALLLSPNAAISTKPELEIFADDVKCSHGATAGEIDENALFYLRARGIPEAEARAILVEAFLGEALAALEDDVLRALAAEAVKAWLAAHAEEVGHGQ
jgi:Fe-S cluster assembly protein SufD